MSNWYDRSQYNEYRPEFEYGHHPFYDHVGNSGWERHPLEGYGSYPGEPNYYPHMHQSYDQEDYSTSSSSLEDTIKLLKSSPFYDPLCSYSSFRRVPQEVS